MKIRALGLVRVAAGLLAALLTAGCFTERQNEGATQYKKYCANCHGEQGQGLRRLIPPLAGSDYLAKNRLSLPCQLRHGLRGPIVVNGVTFNQVMPGTAGVISDTGLTDSEITNLLNYVQTSWGNKGEVFTIREVADALGGCGGAQGR